MARERHVHTDFGSHDDCPECIEHNDITDALLEACEALADQFQNTKPPREYYDGDEGAITIALDAIKLARGEGHDDD